MTAPAQVEAAPPKTITLVGQKIRFLDPPPGATGGPWIVLEDLLKALGANDRHAPEIVGKIQKTDAPRMFAAMQGAFFVHAVARDVALRHVAHLFSNN